MSTTPEIAFPCSLRISDMSLWLGLLMRFAVEGFNGSGVFGYFSNDSFQKKKKESVRALPDIVPWACVYWRMNIQLHVKSSLFRPEKSFLCLSEHCDLLLTVFLARCLSYALPRLDSEIVVYFSFKAPSTLEHVSWHKIERWRKRSQSFTMPLVLYCLQPWSLHWDVTTFISNHFSTLLTIVHSSVVMEIDCVEA